MPKLSEKAKQLRVQKVVPEDAEEGKYANYFEMTATEYEIIFDFGHTVPPDKEAEEAQATIVSRIIIPYALAPKILKVLSNNLEGDKG